MITAQKLAKLLAQSDRLFRVIAHESGTTITDTNLNLVGMLEDDGSELLYSLHEKFDNALDLKVGESFAFNPNRDNQKTFGIVIRVR